jgi:hypothetical protein
VSASRLRLPLLVLVGAQALMYLTMATSNVVDLLASAFGWSASGWRSGNVSWVQHVVAEGHIGIGSPRMWAYLAVLFAATFELLAGIGWAGSTLGLWRRDVPGARVWASRAVAAALTVWLGLALGLEVFIAYETQGWEQFLVIGLVAIVTWIAVELLPTEPRDDGED